MQKTQIELTIDASGTQKIDCWCIILTENQPTLHHANNRNLTIAASCLTITASFSQKIDHGHMVLIEYLALWRDGNLNWYWNIHRKLYEVEWQNCFGN